MTNATVVTRRLTDNSLVYAVAFATDMGRKVATIEAEDKQHAERIADAINSASYIDFYA